ncbi:MAG: toll/interleukin-1 receptor domain-containing protein [Zoogloeaceae bacterium]|nr:toll/interleukin-1 receptor domain-containing protein [Rhodocyclaceae bacterium]MCP5235758.1 toll/interleukin-1 receptor domain-containing protein [Zoogloeaceae bacterium]
MAAAIFISYRRKDAGGHAGRLRDRFAHWFDADALFYDQGSIDSGDRFPAVLEQALAGASVLLVVIGPDWEDLIEERARSAERDWVRHEVETGLARQAAGELILIPLLLGRETQIEAGRLPESLRPLAGIQAHRFVGQDADWNDQFGRLLDLIERAPGVPAPRYRLPTGIEQPFRLIDHALSPHFRDPDGQLEALCELLQGAQRVALVARAALYGMGGLGKTQLALKYSWDNRDRYAGVWWFRAERPDLLEADAAACCTEVGAPQREHEAPSAALKRWLAAQPAGWLLVYDNAEDTAALRPVLPEGGVHHVLLTSRNPAWGGLAAPLGLKTWDEDQGADFFGGRLGSGDRDELRALSKDLGGLPLALEQAAGYLEQTSMAVAEYRRLLADVDTGALVLDVGRASTGYERSVAATLSLAFARLSPAAQQLLRLAAFAAPEPLPERFFVEATGELPEALAAAAANPLAWHGVVGELRRYGLTERAGIAALEDDEDAAEHALILHRLTQQVVRARLADAGQDMPILLTVLHGALPAEVQHPATWKRCASLWPHAVQLAELGGSAELSPNKVVQLLNGTAIYLQQRAALYQLAEKLFERALALSRESLGDEHPDTLALMKNLAHNMWARGDLWAASTLQERLLKVHRRMLGDAHPKTLTSMHDLAATLWALGKLSTARQLQERVVDLRRKILGAEHLETLGSMNNLAESLRVQGYLFEAKALQEQVLEVCKRTLGREALHTPTAMNNLAGTLHALGMLNKAQVLQEEVVAARERVMGADHPETLNAMNGLVGTLRAQGDLDESRRYGERVLTTRQRILGREHPATLTSMCTLADTLRSQGNIAGARKLQESALEGRKLLLGGKHPETSILAWSQFVTLNELGETEAARRVLQEDLLWLAECDPAALVAHQRTIRGYVRQVTGQDADDS